MPAATRYTVNEEKAQKAVVLRRSGATYKQIGEQLGIGTSSALRLVHSELARARKKHLDNTETIKQLMVMRLDALLVELWSFLSVDDIKIEHKLMVIDRIIKVDERRSRLEGIEKAPSLVNINVTDQPKAREELSPILQHASLEEKRKILEILQRPAIEVKAEVKEPARLDYEQPAKRVLQPERETV